MNKRSFARNTLDWMIDRGLDGRNVTIGCRKCREVCTILAGTAAGAWLPFHADHEDQVWMRNPFPKKAKEEKSVLVPYIEKKDA